MPPGFASTSGAMIDDKQDTRRTLGGGFFASILVHVAALALLIFGLPPLSLPEPPQEQAVDVELVPPPEAAEEEPEQAEQPAPPAMPEERPAPAPEEQAQPEPPAEPQQAGPPDSEAAAQQSAMPVLDPVVQYGENESGPEESPDGVSAEEPSSPPDASAALQEEVAAEPPALPEVLATDTVGGLSVSLADPAKTETEPEAVSPADISAKLEEAEKLFSPNVTNDPIATTAIRNLPRGVRVGKLCVTELREQLRRSSPAYSPEFLPQHELAKGTVMVVPLTAFRASLQWYDLSFRCEVDDEALKVVSFAFRVGEPVPASEWRKRGLPSQ